MPNKTNIIVSEGNRKVEIQMPIKDSLHASLFADRLDKLPYLKLINRKFADSKVNVFCHAIKGEFSIEKLHNDLELMSDLTPCLHDSL